MQNCHHAYSKGIELIKIPSNKCLHKAWNFLHNFSSLSQSFFEWSFDKNSTKGKLFTYIDPFSVSKTTRELLLKWSDEPVKLSTEVKMPQFVVEDVIAEACDESSVMGKFFYSHSQKCYTKCHYIKWVATYIYIA